MNNNSNNKTASSPSSRSLPDASNAGNVLSAIFNIRILYDSMGRSEKKIADWILEHRRDIISLSITELAEKCGCGEATIVRFARRLGLSGYQELKISIAQETSGTLIIPNENILKTDSCYNIFTKNLFDIHSALEKSKRVLGPESLDAAADIIITAKKIAIYGLGNSSSIALDAQHKFMRAGLNATAYCDNHMQAIAASHLSKGDVALGISHSGSSRDVVEALKLSREAGASTICITNHGKSPIIKQSDIALYTASEETRYNILGMNSRIAQLAIIDSIYIYVVLRRSDEAAKAIQNTERALLGKKY